jgi:hypothetical protein
VKRSLRVGFRVFTVALLIVSIWTAYANVFSDDLDVRAKAAIAARAHAGCGDKCKQTGLRVDRGMIDERIEHDFDGKGRVVVTCRRANVIVGDYTCTPSKE